jgi:signal transduction histidine kinase|tara:strand:+ start:335 stop:523 length:189 start_codon:yes stop_codon:yes gene_type:complete
MMKASPFVIMFWIFFALKLTGHIIWSWWWVTSPLWIPFVVAFLVISGEFFVCFIYDKFKSKQ